MEAGVDRVLGIASRWMGGAVSGETCALDVRRRWVWCRLRRVTLFLLLLLPSDVN